MSIGIRTCITTVIAALLLFVPTASQETAADKSQREAYPAGIQELLESITNPSFTSFFPPEATTDPWAYSPTGDALWDTYAQALLEQLPGIPFSVYQSGAGVLPNDLLDSWEDGFGNDPRYWQLRYWNEVQRAGFGGEGDSLAIEYMEYGAELGVSDAVTGMLLYKYRENALQDFWDGYAAKTLEQKATFGMPDIPAGHASRLWFRERETLLRDNLVANCPDESWAWYASAMKRFDYGDWEAGLDDMRRGNEAANNRVPLPFPASFVLSRVANEQHCGNEVAAGIIAEGLYSWPLANFIGLKDNIKNQQVRLAMGAPLSEWEPWHHYSCRFGSMEGASAIQWLVALVMRNIQVKYLLVQTPESFTMDERNALWLLNVRAQKIKNLVRYELTNEQPDKFDEQEKIRMILLDYGITMEPEEFRPLEFKLETDNLGIDPEAESALLRELQLVHYRANYHYMKLEYGTVFSLAKERFDQLATFDFATFSWPET